VQLPRFDGESESAEFDGPADFQRFVKVLANGLRKVYNVKRQEFSVGAVETVEAFTRRVSGINGIAPCNVFRRIAIITLYGLMRGW